MHHAQHWVRIKHTSIQQRVKPAREQSHAALIKQWLCVRQE
jgi:hypothetical protein